MSTTQTSNSLDWLSGGGEMSRVIRSKDWSKSPLGPIDSWPQSLRTTVSLCLASNFPISIAWGEHYTQIYNDGYWPICGAKHPYSMGQDFRECWASAWPAIGAVFDQALAGQTSYLENQRMFLDRYGFLEETFFTFSFSPIRDEAGRVAGLFHPVTETTANVLNERRVRTLRDLAARTGKARAVEEAMVLVAQTLQDSSLDLPFALLYLLDPEGSQARLVGSTGLAPGTRASPEQVDLRAPFETDWPIAQVACSVRIEQVDGLEDRFGPLHCGPYPEPVRTAMLLPVGSAGEGRPVGVLIAGVSTRLAFNEPYRTFYEMLAASVTTALNNARSYEQERKRAEALAEIDRAKTAFFSNVSHEFRTPLTLMLGPLEELLAGHEGALPPAVLDEVEVVHRNALRLLKLVNALLDFSRLEASRIQSVFEPTELGSLTEDLASAFRSAIERAGMKLHIHTPPLDEPIYVDREMWEKIVLNLVSNAFKYTHQGEIHVELAPRERAVELSVRDTGTGIPEHELSKIFDRFHRVKGVHGRTHEGTGIGLALVQELVKLHGGSVRVESTLGQGSTFTVSIPRGKAHLPPERISSGRKEQVSTATHAEAFVEEALRWLPDASPAAHPGAPESDTEATPKRLLLADDNADMREYMRRLLSPRYQVVTVADGEQALAEARRNPPDLILSDIMMPHMDGIELVKALRADPALRTMPIILLSARAGEEARAGGIESGADDYLTKPFSSKELLARVRSQLQMVDVRRRAIEQEALAAHLARHQHWLESVLDLLPTPLLLLEPEQGRVAFANREAHRLAGGALALGAPLEAQGLPAYRGGRVRDNEVEWRTPAGRFSLLVDSEQVPALEGQPARTILSMRDISRLKTIQEELQRAIGVRDEFLSIASHELNTPVTSLKMQVQLLQREFKPASGQSPSPARVARFLDMATGQVERMALLIDALLDVSRIGAGTLTLHPEPVEVSELVREVVERLMDQSQGTRCAVDVQVEQPILVDCDRLRVEQVVTNLFANALKYGAGKPIHVTVLPRPEGGARIVVRDEGMGIAREKHAKVFDRFERAISSQNISGLGLGLYIVREIVNAHGGSIQLESDLGQGATFTVELPSGHLGAPPVSAVSAQARSVSHVEEHHGHRG
jgi:signal transduction histidine kinase